MVLYETRSHPYESGLEYVERTVNLTATEYTFLRLPSSISSTVKVFGKRQRVGGMGGANTGFARVRKENGYPNENHEHEITSKYDHSANSRNSRFTLL